LLGKNRRLKAEIESYRQKLASSETVQLDETIGCHAAMLVLSDDPEQRVRCIQSLAQSKAEIAVPAAVKELVRLSHGWPKKEVGGWPLLLLSVLRRFETAELYDAN
jgi:hypothetical protein